MHPRAPSVGEPVSRLALQAAISILPCWSKAGSSAILRPSVLTHAISAIGGVVTMRGVVAQPNSGISMAVEHHAGIHRLTDITGTLLRLTNPHSLLSHTSRGKEPAHSGLHILAPPLPGVKRSRAFLSAARYSPSPSTFVRISSYCPTLSYRPIQAISASIPPKEEHTICSVPVVRFTSAAISFAQERASPVIPGNAVAVRITVIIPHPPQKPEQATLTPPTPPTTSSLLSDRACRTLQ